MLALKACRSGVARATRLPTATRLAPTLLRPLSSIPNAISDLVYDITLPPTAGTDGYPTVGPAAPNPLSKNNTPNRNSSISDILVRPKYRLHCHSTRNNTITTFTDENGLPLVWFSGGSCGFKKGNRASYEAGYQCAVRMFKTIANIHKKKPVHIDLFFKGFGQGRDALRNALLAAEGEHVRPLVVSITDRTAIKIGGTRAKKTRRL